MSLFQIKRHNDNMVANSIDELMTLAKNGTLRHGDLIKVPGSNEWLYAGELPKIQDHLSLDTYKEPVKTNKALGIFLLLIAIGLFFGAYHFKNQIPSADDLEFVGSNGLQENQAMLTTNSKAYKSAKGKSSIGTLSKDSIVLLLEKRGELFKVESPKGTAWVSMYDLAPAYLFAGKSVRDKYDALFNTHRKILAQNASWERPIYGSNITNFYLQLQNLSPYDVEDIIVSIDMKDGEGEIIRSLKLELEGKILAGDSSVIGTLNPPKRSSESPRLMTRNKLTELERQDPKLLDRWVESIEVTLGDVSFKGASIKVTQANAISKD